MVRKTKLDPAIGAIWDTRGCQFLVSDIKTMRTRKKAQEGESNDNGSPKKSTMKSEKKLGLYDLLEDKFVWNSRFSDDTMGCLIEQDRIALLNPEGILKVMDVQTGVTQFETESGLQGFQKRTVTGMGVVSRGDKLLFHFKSGETFNRVEINDLDAEVKYINYNDVMWKGLLVCIDAKTGEGAWRRPVRFDNFQIGQGQPFNMPFYLLARRVEHDDKHGSRIDFLNLAGIDWKTGELVFNELQTYGYPNQMEIRCQPEDQQITIRFATTDIVYQIRQIDDAPPRPVANLTNQNSIPNAKAIGPSFAFDKTFVEAAKIDSLRRAKAAQALLPKRQAEEKRLLEKERAGK